MAKQEAIEKRKRNPIPDCDICGNARMVLVTATGKPWVPADGFNRFAADCQCLKAWRKSFASAAPDRKSMAGGER